MTRVVTHHAHHPEEGVYRLIHAETAEVLVHRGTTDDEYGAKVIEAVETVYADHQDIVWADDDPRWRGMPQEKIAAAQRQDCSDAIARLERRRTDAAKRQPAIRHLPRSAGRAL